MSLALRRKAQCPKVKRTYTCVFALTPSHLVTQFTWKAMLYEQDGNGRLAVTSAPWRTVVFSSAVREPHPRPWPREDH